MRAEYAAPYSDALIDSPAAVGIQATVDIQERQVIQAGGVRMRRWLLSTLVGLVAVSGVIGFLPAAAAQAKSYCISYGPIHIAIFARCPS